VPEPPALDVTVRGPSEVDERQRSAEAVTVVETELAKRQTAELGEVLARTQGVGVRRAGGLGSDTRFFPERADRRPGSLRRVRGNSLDFPSASRMYPST
jgi:hypothetical protein